MAKSISPYFDIYSVFFENGRVTKIEKTEKGTRLSEKGALKILGYPDTNVDVEVKLSLQSNYYFTFLPLIKDMD